MTIQGFYLAGYRCFKEHQELKLGQLNLLYGKNNSGKSSLLRLPSLIAGSVTGPPGLRLELPAVGGATFRDIVWRHEPFVELGIRVDDQEWGWKLEWREVLNAATPMELIVPVEQNRTKLYWKPKDRGERSAVRHFKDNNSRSYQIELTGLLPTGAGIDSSRLAHHLKKTRWLAGIRKGPERFGVRQGIRPHFHHQGGEWSEALIYESLIREGVSKWFEEYTGHRIVLTQLPGYKRVSLQLVSENAPDVAFPDAGEGLQQVFPVLVALEQLRQDGGLLCIEEPEAHLHPSLQRGLASHIREVLREQPNAQVLLETHSEVFLYEALLGRIVDQSTEVRLHWVQMESGASVIREVPLDSNGRPTDETLLRAFSDVGALRRDVIRERRNAR